MPPKARHRRPDPNQPALWELRQFGREHNPAGRHYWFDNARREPAGILVIQASLQGHLVIQDHTGTHQAPQGSIILFRYGEPSIYHRPDPHDGPYRCAWIGLLGAGVEQHANTLRDAHGPVIDTTTDRGLIDQLERVIDTADPARNPEPTHLAAMAYTFVANLFRHVRDDRQAQLPPAQQAVEQITRQPLIPWSIKTVADRYNISREHLCRTFRQLVGQTPHEFLSNQRVQAAINLLTQTSLSVEDVAHQCGFVSTHTLARHVKQHTGHSPTQLRAAQSTTNAR